MGFRESLEEVCAVEGAVAASVMGFDGIAIDTVTPAAPSVDLEALLVEYGGILSHVKQAAEILQTGKVNELSVGTDRLTTLLRPINPEYFLVLAMTPDGNHGKGRYLLRVNAPRLQNEF
ncbi:roadblock/LC7 domain-containing protein [Vulgatibacter sp.]|uniref:roadblock/LC7 domain-containing protein n=1 Tax=Vulgatibacter sp. TaxID=1971226 RepID=UPI003569670A